MVAGGTPREVLTEKLIRSVYEVDARVVTDEDGLLRILYQPRRGGEGGGR